MANIISTKAINAFNNCVDFQLSNTAVVNFENTTRLLLWGNRILWKDNASGKKYFCLCGWDTHTTCERLRAAGLPINHKRGKLYFDNQQIDDCKVYLINDCGQAVAQ